MLAVQNFAKFGSESVIPLPFCKAIELWFLNFNYKCFTKEYMN